MPKAMVITVGVGETVSHGICFSIKEQNPDYIVFILTKESKGKTLPIILQDAVMQDKRYEEYILSDENDVEEICFECQKVIDDLKRRFDLKDISLDYTSGTKAMSAGVVLAGLDKNIGSLVYVSGKRNKNGRVISGTERLISLEPNRSYAESLFKEAVDLFNSCQFDGCLQITNQAKNLLADSQFLERINLLEKLACSYSLWDKFDFKKAFVILNEISKDELLANWGIKRKVEDNKEVLYREKDTFCLEKVVDLLENAKRRGDIEKKYDDAVARLYRLLEYIAQFKIAQRDLYKKDDKGNSDPESLNIDKLTSGLKDKYLKYKDSKDGKVKLGLYQDYELLYDLDDELGKVFKEEYEKGILKKLLSLRNNSILAHGFNPISEDTYREMYSLMERFIRSVFPEIDNVIQKIRFPQIKT